MSEKEDNTLNTAKQQIILDAIREGNSLAHACEEANISRHQVYRLRKKDPDFERQYNEALQSQNDIVEDALLESAKDGKVTAQMFWLTNRAPQRWKNKKEMKHNGDVNLTLKDIIEQCEEEKEGKEKIPEQDQD